MPSVRKIALVTCASNFERYGNMIRAMQRKLRELGPYALYVLSNYGIYTDGMDYRHGEPAIYSLLESMELDGCILEANLGSNELVQRIVQILTARNIPALTINLQVEGIPRLELDTRKAGSELLTHLIRDHGCERINLVLNATDNAASQVLIGTYRRVLEERGLSFDERRVLFKRVSSKNGRALYDDFDQRGVMRDAQAVLCVHDVHALGLIMELEDRGFRVPEDMKICSMNCSANSIAFKPAITGVDRNDRQAAEMALVLMDRLIRGEAVEEENIYSSLVRYHSSCGCRGVTVEPHEPFHRMVLNKIEAGNQIGRMMQFTDGLEKVNSLSQFADNIHMMMEGLDVRSWFCCLNESDLAYIESNREDERPPEAPPYDKSMRLIMGYSEREGLMRDITFPVSRVIPAEPGAGDLFILLPIHHIARDYGYMVIMNDLLPADMYNYRICQESLGINIENLHRQMVLRFSIEELDKLHMQDQMTGLHNRFALRRYADHFVSGCAGYAVAMLDMDGLKDVNDTFGHLAGNNAISIAANAIRQAAEQDDLVIRYGGDEFLILSLETDAADWEARRTKINLFLAEAVNKQKLPYPLGVSMGYAVSPAEKPLSLDRCIEIADAAMYEDKKARKARWN